MAYRLALLCLLASPAVAQDYIPAGPEQISLFEDAQPGDQHFARITVQNNEGSGNSETTFETAHGPVTVNYLSTVNAPCRTEGAPPEVCADIVTLVDWPDGVVPSEVRIELVEGGVAEILLFHHLGF